MYDSLEPKTITNMDKVITRGIRGQLKRRESWGKAVSNKVLKDEDMIKESRRMSERLALRERMRAETRK
jgi:hypothetical protein